MKKRGAHRYAHEPLWKRYLPHTLFGRAFLILAVPVLLLQVAAYIIFHENHWDSVTRNLARSLSGEVLLVMDLYDQGAAYEQMVRYANRLGFSLSLDTKENIDLHNEMGIREFPEFFDHMQRHTKQPLMLTQVGDDEDLLVTILMEDNAVMQLVTSKKRLGSSTTTIFLLWLGGSSAFLVVVATLFLRNQIRPIKQLARAAKRFGLGHDVPDFSPRGAEEVRLAGRAFLEMRDRIQRYVHSRTEMLAGISHDLRTPLTRMKLQIAMSSLEEKSKQELEGDIVEMEHMIAEYLDFAKGEGGEASMRVELMGLVQELLEDYERQKADVTWDKALFATPQMTELKPRAFKRALQNIIDNAIRYGKRASVHLERRKDAVRITIEDEGPGIPEDKIEIVFQAFKRLDESRNPQQGGAGLGLSIARDLMQAQGGTIEIENRTDASGLRVRVSVPLI